MKNKFTKFIAFRRRREKRTDYQSRLQMLKSGKPRVVVRRGISYLHVQVVAYGKTGDVIVLETSSKILKKFGWKAHCGNLSASYLTGLYVGKKLAERGIEEVILDIGMQTSTKQNSIYALCKGLVDAGISVPIGDKVMPTEQRIRGEHVANYASHLKSNKSAFEKQFGAYIKSSLDPQKIVEHFEEVKAKIEEE